MAVNGVSGNNLTGSIGMPSSSGQGNVTDARQLVEQLLQDIERLLGGASNPSASAPPAAAGSSGTGGMGGTSSLASSGGTPPAAPASASAPAGTGSAGDPASASGASSIGSAFPTGPGKVNLAGFGSLQLPSGSDGNVDTVGSGSLGNYNSQYFNHNANGSITMTVPPGGGAHTAHSNFPRSELAESGSWKLSNGTSTLSATTSVDKLPKSGDVVIGQIHQKAENGGKPRPPVELHYDKGNIVASVMDSNSPDAARHNVTIATGVKPGQKFSYSMQTQPDGKLTISAAGQTKTVALDPSFQSSDMYFKAGNYCQDPSGGSQVSFYGLNISHGSN
jgi:hypothetical protein